MISAIGPTGLAKTTAAKTEGPTDLRVGTIAVVTPYGIEVDVAEGRVPASHLSSYNPAVGDPVTLIRYQDAWMALGRPVGPGTSDDAATPGLGAGTTLLAGVALSGTGTTMASSSGSAVVVPRYGITFHHPPGHWVLILFGFNWYSSVVNDWLTVRIRNASFGGAILGGTNLIQAGNVFFGTFTTIGALIPPSPYGGSGSSYYVDLQRVSGTGTSRVDDVAAQRGYLAALDLGDGSMIATV